MSPNMKILIIIIVIILALYLIFNVSEGFVNTTPVISLKDVNSMDDKTAINALAQISKSLMDGKLTVPGDLKITGTTSIGNAIVISTSGDISGARNINMLGDISGAKNISASGLCNLGGSTIDSSGNMTTSGTVSAKNIIATGDTKLGSGKITTNGKGFMYLKFKLGPGVLTQVIDGSGNKILGTDYICFSNILNVDGISSNGTVYVNKSDGYWWMINPHTNAINQIDILCIPTSFFSFSSLAYDNTYVAFGTANATRNIVFGYSLQTDSGEIKKQT
jgi:hypothetical protein